MKRYLAALLLVASSGYAQTTGTSSAATTSIIVNVCISGLPSIPVTFTLKNEAGDTIDTKVSAAGGACRSVQHTGLTAHTAYRVNVDAGAPYDVIVSSPVVTHIDPGGSVVSPFQTAAPKTYDAGARAKVVYGPTIAMAGGSLQNTNCPAASGCTISPSLTTGHTYYEIQIQDASDNILARTAPSVIAVGGENRYVLTGSVNGAEPAIPDRATWLSRATTEGVNRCAALVDYGSTYYDSGDVYWKLGDLTGNWATWRPCHETAISYYRDGYVNPNNGGLPGYWKFTEGLRKHFEETGVGADNKAVCDIASHGAYCSTDYTSGRDYPARSRELAYCFRARLDAYRMGCPAASVADMADVRDVILSQVTGSNGWTPTNTTWRESVPFDLVPDCAGKFYFQPFMGALTSFSLAKCIEERPDLCGTTEKNAIKAIADLMWQQWISADQSMSYENCKTLPTDPWPATLGGTGYTITGSPDLGMETAPVFALVYKYTCDTSYRDKADAAWAGAVSAAYIVQNKQFNEYTYWAIGIFDQIRGPKELKQQGGDNILLENNDKLLREVACP